MAMDPITWLLLVAATISIYLTGIILSKITLSRNKHQLPQEIQESVEYPMELQPEPEANIQIAETPVPEEVNSVPEPSVNTSTDQVKDEGQELKERFEDTSEGRSDEKSEEVGEQPKTEERIFKPYTPRNRELKRKDMIKMLETAQELKGELLRLRTILEKG